MMKYTQNDVNRVNNLKFTLVLLHYKILNVLFKSTQKKKEYSEMPLQLLVVVSAPCVDYVGAV